MGAGRRIKSWQHLFENARPDMIGEKSILLKMRDGPNRKPFKVSDSIKDGAGIISRCEEATDLLRDLGKN